MTQPTEPTILNKQDLGTSHQNYNQERRIKRRIIAFCRVFNLKDELVGISFDLTTEGICFSLPNTWTHESPFSVMLKRTDNPSLPSPTLSVELMWREPYNENYDAMGCKILSVDSQSNFSTFVNYCQIAGPDGLS